MPVEKLIAQAVYNPQLSANLQNLSGWEFANTIVPYFILLCFVVGAIVFFFMFVIGGVQWITSAGNKNTLEDARRKILHAFIGLFILLSIYAVVKIVEVLFAISLLGGVASSGGGITPTPAPAGTCQCSSLSVLTNACNYPNVAQCVSPDVCECRTQNYCYDPGVDYWRGCFLQGGTFVCNGTLVCEPATAECRSQVDPNAECCWCDTSTSTISCTDNLNMVTNCPDCIQYRQLNCGGSWSPVWCIGSTTPGDDVCFGSENNCVSNNGTPHTSCN